MNHYKALAIHSTFLENFNLALYVQIFMSLVVHAEVNYYFINKPKQELPCKYIAVLLVAFVQTRNLQKNL